MRATKPRGTRSGNCVAAASETGSAAVQTEQRQQLARIADGLAPQAFPVATDRFGWHRFAAGAVADGVVAGALAGCRSGEAAGIMSRL